MIVFAIHVDIYSCKIGNKIESAQNNLSREQQNQFFSIFLEN